MFTSSADRLWGQADSQRLTAREEAILRAVADERVELRCSCEPDLYIDGLFCSDQYTAHLLSRQGLIQPRDQVQLGQRVRAELTDAGRAALPGEVGQEAPARGETRGPGVNLHRC